MEIALKWKNRSPSAEGTRIFRSEDQIFEENLPEPIATVGPGIETFNDSDVSSGEKYFYRTQVFKGDNASLSSQLEALAVVRSGPGPQALLDGDLETGYYGTIDNKDFVDASTLSTFLGLTAGSLTSIPAEYQKWFKFAYNGKTLFIPMYSLRNNISWRDIYNAGAVFGVDGPGEPPSGVTAVNQKRVITIGGEKFLIRLMTGAGSLKNFTLLSTDTGFNGSAGDTVGCDGSEWNDLIYRIYNFSPKPISMRNKTLFPGALPVAAFGNTGYGTTITQDIKPDTSGNICVRGASYPAYNVHRIGVAAFIPNNSLVHQIYFNGWVSFILNWRPVLEWIP